MARLEGESIASRVVRVCALDKIVRTILPSGPRSASVARIRLLRLVGFFAGASRMRRASGFLAVDRGSWAPGNGPSSLVEVDVSECLVSVVRKTQLEIPIRG